MSTKTWIIFAVIVVALFGGLIAISRKDQVSVDSVDITKVQAAASASGNIADHVYGKADSKVILIEYGDYQCPGCGAAFPVLKEFSQQYKDKIAFVFRNNPLTAIHPNAKAAAAAAEAAGLQGKFWEMHDKLYESQDSWSQIPADQRTDRFVSYAVAVGVTNIDKFKDDIAGQTVNKKIDFDLALGGKAGVEGTPTIILNNKKLESDTWNDKAKFKKVVDDALAGQK